MKILFIYPDIRGSLRIHQCGYFYTGIASLSAVLKNNNYSVSLLHYLHEPFKNKFISDIIKENPDLVAYSATTNMFTFVKKWSYWIRRYFPAKIQICGGVHPTLNTNSSLEESDLDAVCIGEGEEPLLELCKHLERGASILENNIKNIVYKDHSRTIKHNALNPVMSSSELNQLPYPDRELFDDNKICDMNRPIVFVSRGCPYNCTYCCNEVLRKKTGNGKAVRTRSVSNVIGEMKYIIHLYPHTNGFHFDDDIFGINRNWLQKFVVAYKKEISLPFSCNTRANLINNDIIRLLVHAGCDEVAMGVETGNRKLRNKVLARDMSNTQITSAFRQFEEAGITTHSYNMTGLPHETICNSLETIKLNSILKKKKWTMKELRITIFYPYKGTRLYHEAEKHNMLTEKDVVNYSDDTIIKSKTMSGHQIRFIAKYFRILVLIYQIILINSNNFQKVILRMFDKFITSKMVGKILFPFFNAIYPLLVKIFRLLSSKG